MTQPPPGVPQWSTPTPTQRPPTNVLAIIALVLTFVFAPAGLICGIIARRQIRETHEDGDGMAQAAVIVSIVFMALWVLFFGIAAVGVLSVGIHDAGSITEVTSV